MRRCLAGTDDSNALLYDVWIGMNDQEDHLDSDHTYRMPPLLPIFKTIRHDEMQRVIKDLLREIERHAVLCKVPPGFFRVPFELQASP